jgi:chlorophyll synthase
MTLNDFKAVAGDRQTGIRSLPAELGVDNAALIACAMMAIPQFVVVIRVATWGRPGYAIAISLLLMGQLILMRRLLNDPRKNAPWYNTTGTMLYVLGMLVSAFAVRTMHGG